MTSKIITSLPPCNTSVNSEETTLQSYTMAPTKGTIIEDAFTTTTEDFVPSSIITTFQPLHQSSSTVGLEETNILDLTIFWAFWRSIVRIGKYLEYLFETWGFQHQCLFAYILVEYFKILSLGIEKSKQPFNELIEANTWWSSIDTRSFSAASSAFLWIDFCNHLFSLAH